MKEIIKRIIKKIPIAFTQNQRYDAQTKQIINRVCKRDSNCIDIGCHAGEVLDIIRKAAPEGKHFGFEPLPHLYNALKTKYKNTSCIISDVALSNVTGVTTFNYVISNPAYSGLKKRKYDRAGELDTTIDVVTEKLDDVIPTETKIDFIKIDVEGGEYLVLEGAIKCLKKNKPIVIFEFGSSAWEIYKTSPAQLFNLLTGCGLKVSLMARWLKNENAFSLKEFEEECYSERNYYFIAY